MKFALIFLLLCHFSVFSQQDTSSIAFPPDPTGYDTLPVHEWDVPTKHNSLPLLLTAGLLFPGGAQYYTGHTVRGGFLTGFELFLLSDVFIGKVAQNEARIKNGSLFRDSVSYYTRLLLDGKNLRNFANLEAGRLRNIQKLRLENDKKMKQEDLRKSETAWLFGLHLYGLMDGYGIWLHNQGRDESKKTIGSVLWRGALVPGWGQIYNGEWGKAGLLYMTFGASWVSYFSRQKMVDYYLDRLHAAKIENASSAEIDGLQEDLTFYRKKRNQYVWATLLFYLYSLADASVDALLSDFDSPVHLTLAPMNDGISSQVILNF